MKDYLLTVIITSVCIGVCEILIPKHQGIDRAVKLIGMLIILTSVISPISSFLKNIDENFVDYLKDGLIPEEDSIIEEYESILRDFLSDCSLLECEEKIKDLLEETYKVKRDECDVRIFTELKDGSIAISRIQILLSGNAIFKNPYNIENYIGEIFNTECTVLVNDRR